VKRREFITLLGSAAAWPLVTHAQQPGRIRHVGVLVPVAADNTEFQARIGAFLQGLQQLGWGIGGNLRIDTRWAGVNAERVREHAAELAALAPDVILAHGSTAMGGGH
jgi:putative ABC transport system substrate-binding protein